MIGILAAGLITAMQVGPTYCKLARSARSFQENLRTLEQSKASLNQVERFVFSLMLPNAKTPPQGKSPAPRRTT